MPREWSSKPKEVHVPDMPLEGVGNAFAIGMKGLVVLLLAALAIVIAVFLFRRARLPVIAPRRRREATLETHLETIEAEARLPDDLAGATRRLWSGGHRREALALLYRGCAEAVAAAMHSSVPVDATEADCLRSARQLEEPRRQRAVAIVRAWQYAAYADRYPRDEDFEQLLAGWPATGGAAA